MERTNWLRQERNSKGHFMPYKKGKENVINIKGIEHAFYAGLKSNNSFYPPSKLWEFYKRDRGIE